MSDLDGCKICGAPIGCVSGYQLERAIESKMGFLKKIKECSRIKTDYRGMPSRMRSNKNRVTYQLVIQ